MKLNGQCSYLVDGYTVVHSGRPIPVANVSILHGEGVGFILDPMMMMAWRRLGMLCLLAL